MNNLLDTWNKNNFSIYTSEELTVLEILEHLNKDFKYIVKIIDNIKDVYEYLKGVISEEMEKILQEMYENGELEQLINEVIFNDLNTKIENLEGKSIITLTNCPFNLVGINDNETINNIITYLNNKGGGIVYLDKEEIYLDSVTLRSNVDIIGKATLIKSPSEHTGSMFIGNNIKNVKFDGLTFKNSSFNANFIEIRSTDNSNWNKNITIQNCKFSDTVSNVSQVLFFGYNDKITVDNNIFESTKSNNTDYLVKFDHSEYEHGYNHQFFIKNNMFTGAGGGFATQGNKMGAGEIYVENNKFRNHNFIALNLYHCNGFYVRGNVIRDCTSKKMSNNDGGVVFLDLANPTATHKTSFFTENVIFNCVGNGIYAEELEYTIIANNTIRDISLRDTIYTKTHTYGDYTSTHESRGGKGILLTGGCSYNTIQGNVIRNTASSGIELNRIIGVQEWYNITGNLIKNNTIKTDNVCISIQEKTDATVIKGNILTNHSETLSTNYGILIDKINGNANSVTNFVYAQENHIKCYNGIVKTYSYNRVCAVNNIIEYNTDGKSIQATNNQGYATGNVLVINNVIQ